MWKDDANYFLKKVHEYYAVGMPAFVTGYEGTEKIKKIMDDKFKAIEDRESVSYKFSQSLQKEMPLLKVDNVNYISSPNYSIGIHLLPSKEGKIIHRSSFEIVVSLLCDYYTYFLVDQFILEGFYEERFTSRFEVFSHEQSLKRTHEVLVPVVENLQKFFPEKKYISYQFLADNYVESSLPFGQNVEIPANKTFRYSFLDLLFTDAYNFSAPVKTLK